MADKMMRIGGRYVDKDSNGYAKPIMVNEQGQQETRNTTSRKLFENGDINRGAFKETGILKSDGYAGAVLNFTHGQPIKVLIQFYGEKRLSPSELEGYGYKTIYESNSVISHHSVEYSFLSEYYSLKIESTSQANGFMSDNLEIRKDSLEIPEVQKVRMTNIKDFQQIELNFPSIPAGQTIIVDVVPETVGILWNVKFMTAIIDSGQVGSRIKLEWRLGAEDNVNRFMELYGYSGRIYLTPSGLTEGELRTPVEFSNNKIPQFWEHLQSVAYIDRNTPSRFMIQNTSSATIESPQVRLYVMEERI